MDILQQEMRAAQARLASAPDEASKNRAVDDINGLNNEIARLHGKNPSVGGGMSTRAGATPQDTSGIAGVVSPRTTFTPTPVDTEGQGILSAMFKDKVPDLSDADAAKKVLANRDRFGIPALLEQRKAAADKFQDAQDKAVAEKRAVTNKKNSGEEGLRGILSGMNDAIDKRTVYRSADLLSGGNKGYEAFRTARDARELTQVGVEDAQRAARFDMEQKLQEAQILYAQGNQAAAEALVAKVLDRQEKLRDSQRQAAVSVATNTSNERAHQGTNDATRYVADKGYEKAVDVQGLKPDTGAVRELQTTLSNYQKDIDAHLKEIEKVQYLDPVKAQALSTKVVQLRKQMESVRQQGSPYNTTEGGATPTAGALDLSKWGAPAVVKP
jgi:hypothetical protein